MDITYYVPTTPQQLSVLHYMTEKITKKLQSAKSFLSEKSTSQFLEELTKLGPHYIKGRRL